MASDYACQRVLHAPRVFDWLIAERLGVCVNPSVSAQAALELETREVDLLINLHERPESPQLLDRLGARTVHLPVPDSHPPSQDQLDQGVTAIRDGLARGERVAVHCAAGLGRSGTLLAAYLVSQGSGPQVAIDQVRAARPGSVETAEQEAAVHTFAKRHASGMAGRA